MLAPLKELTNQKLIIFGLGQEGWSSYRFLKEQLPAVKITLVDEKPLAELAAHWQTAIDQDKATSWLPATKLDSLTISDANHTRLGTTLFKTPGLPANHPAIKKLLKSGVKLTSNTQLFFDLITVQQKKSPDLNLTTIGVTGTKGKSTTTSLIHHLLKENGIKSYLAGNIGRPALSSYQAWQESPRQTPQEPSFFVLELSSHQLAELNKSPQIAIIQTIVSEHLDYYPDFASYFAAKTNIVKHQQAQDWVIYNQTDQHASRLAKLSPGKKTGFDLESNQELIQLAKETSLLGRHNLYNTLPAIIIGQQFGLNSAQITEALKTFKPLPHRLQLITEINGVEYYDDSIATNPKATVAALKTFSDRPVILLAGGYERQQDFSNLAAEILKQDVKGLALFPPTGSRLKTEIKKASSGETPQQKMAEFTEMKLAVEFAAELAKPGDVVLLSPAAASFGLFANYKDRGKQFEQAVRALTKSP